MCRAALRKFQDGGSDGPRQLGTLEYAGRRVVDQGGASRDAVLVAVDDQIHALRFQCPDKGRNVAALLKCGGHLLQKAGLLPPDIQTVTLFNPLVTSFITSRLIFTSLTDAVHGLPSSPSP